MLILMNSYIFHDAFLISSQSYLLIENTKYNLNYIK